MLLSAPVLFAASAGTGVLGLVIAYKKPLAALVPVAIVLALTAATILQLRDPFALALAHRHEMESWDYIAVLFWSTVIGLSLPALGVYLRALRKGGRGLRTKN